MKTDENGRVRTYIAPNDASATYNYDQTGKLSDLAIATPKQMLLLEKYEYDKTGNRTKIKHESPDGKIKETNYVYDPINQLLKESTPNGTVRDYTYDGFGNRTSVKVTENGKETKSVIATFNEGNQLLKFGNESLTYDANGNRTSDGKYTYTWNEADQLVAVTKKGEGKPFATYKYDNENRRIEKNVNGQVTRYFYDGDSINPLYETDGNGKVLRQYVYNKDGVRLAMKIQDQSVYYYYNPRGDVIAMTDKDGQIVASYEYDAWGNVLKSEAKGIAADNPFGYAGYMYDKEIGMYYLIARYYNPDHGVLLSVDPDGHWAYRPWGTTPMPYYNDRTRYAHFKGVKSGLSAVRDSYAGFVGFGNVMNKLLTFGVGANYGWKSSKNKSKNQIANLSPGQRVVKQKNIKNTVKSAVKGAFFVGSKAVGGIGLIPDIVVYVDGYYKGDKKGYTNYKPKKTNSKKRRR